jgi:aliphatic nitrilase
MNKPNYLDSEATLEKALGLIAEASGNCATLIVFPENFLPGYPYWSINLGQGPEWAGAWAPCL